MAMSLIRFDVHLLPPTRFPNFQIRPSQTRLRIWKNMSDNELAMDLVKMKTQMSETQEAMKASRKLLYAELCLYLGLGKEELRTKWERMGEDDKRVVAQEFVSDWGSNFHPLSANSVKELVDQHLFHANKEDDDDSSSSSYLFGGLKKLMGFTDNK